MNGIETDISGLSAFLGGMEFISIIAAALIGYIGIIIMGFGTLRGLVLFIICTKRCIDRSAEIRMDIAKHLALGLEFLVAKDIIETLIQPTFQRLLLLAFIIAIRTAISVILSWELRQAIEEITEEKEFEEAMREYEDARKKLKEAQKKKVESETGE